MLGRRTCKFHFDISRYKHHDHKANSIVLLINFISVLIMAFMAPAGFPIESERYYRHILP